MFSMERRKAMNYVYKPCCMTLVTEPNREETPIGTKSTQFLEKIPLVFARFLTRFFLLKKSQKIEHFSSSNALKRSKMSFSWRPQEIFLEMCAFWEKKTCFRQIFSKGEIFQGIELILLHFYLKNTDKIILQKIHLSGTLT